MRKKWIIVASIVLGILLIGFGALLLFGDRVNRHLIDTVGFHSGTATVVKKEVVTFDERNYSYLNDHGDTVEARPGDRQYRVYYRHDEFNAYNEPLRTQLLRAEDKLISEGKPHFTWKNYNDSSWFDTIQVGDKLTITYRAYSDGYIEVASVKKAKS
ncbi:MAG TPA: hypothetical protein VJT71_13710 [Pyrinomonadaceae bacterium]|nr:hypothetical protein [Pyrinomonadaceae bacterium]